MKLSKGFLKNGIPFLLPPATSIKAYKYIETATELFIRVHTNHTATTSQSFPGLLVPLFTGKLTAKAQFFKAPLCTQESTSMPPRYHEAFLEVLSVLFKRELSLTHLIFFLDSESMYHFI